MPRILAKKQMPNRYCVHVHCINWICVHVEHMELTSSCRRINHQLCSVFIWRWQWKISSSIEKMKLLSWRSLYTYGILLHIIHIFLLTCASFWSEYFWFSRCFIIYRPIKTRDLSSTAWSTNILSICRSHMT